MPSARTAEELLPGVRAALDDPLSILGRGFFKRYGNPLAATRLGPKRFGAALERAAGRYGSPKTIARLWDICRRAVDLNGKSGTALDFEDLTEELRFVLDELEQVSQRLERIRKKLEAQMTELDPKGILTSIPGVGIVTAAACLVALGTHEFRNAKAFRSYTGLVPRVSESGQSRSRGLSLTKAGPAWLRTALYLAADVARRWDPELAAIYQRAMVTKAHPHRKAVCAVAAHLAGRVWAVWRDQRPYEVRVSAAQAVVDNSIGQGA